MKNSDLSGLLTEGILIALALASFIIVRIVVFSESVPWGFVAAMAVAAGLLMIGKEIVK